MLTIRLGNYKKDGVKMKQKLDKRIKIKKGRENNEQKKGIAYDFERVRKTESRQVEREESGERVSYLERENIRGIFVLFDFSQ